MLDIVFTANSRNREITSGRYRTHSFICMYFQALAVTGGTRSDEPTLQRPMFYGGERDKERSRYEFRYHNSHKKNRAGHVRK